MRWLPALLLVIVLVFPLFLASLSTIAVATFAIDRGFYRRIVDDERLYEVPDLLTDSFPGLEAFPLEHASKALREVLTPAYLRGQVRHLLDQVFEFIEGRATLQPVVDLAPVKAALAGEAGRRFALALAKDLPECEGAVRSQPGALPACRPAGTSVEQAARQIEAALPAVIEQMPDRLPFGGTVELPWRGFSASSMLVATAVGLLALSCGAWFAAAFAGGADRRTRLLWLSSSLAAPAAVVLLIGLVALSSFTWGWMRSGLAEARLDLQGFGAGFVDAVTDAARYAVRRVALGFLASGGVAAGLAVGLLAWALSISREGRGSTPVAAQVSSDAGGPSAGGPV